MKNKIKKYNFKIGDVVTFNGSVYVINSQKRKDWMNNQNHWFEKRIASKEEIRYAIGSYKRLIILLNKQLRNTIKYAKQNISQNEKELKYLIKHKHKTERIKNEKRIIKQSHVVSR